MIATPSGEDPPRDLLGDVLDQRLEPPSLVAPVRDRWVALIERHPDADRAGRKRPDLPPEHAPVGELLDPGHVGVVSRQYSFAAIASLKQDLERRGARSVICTSMPVIAASPS